MPILLYMDWRVTMVLGLGVWALLASVASLLRWVRWRLAGQLSRLNSALTMRRGQSQFVLGLFVILLAALIVQFPGWAPWAFVMNRSVGFGAMLGGAAGLLAVLIFAASQAQMIENKVEQGETYLHIKIANYLVRRSRTATIMWLPLFQVMTVGLFVIPPAKDALPRSWVPPFADSHGLSSVDVQLLVLGFWCACYATVGGTLLLNVTGSLRSSRTADFQKSYLRLKIRGDLTRASEEAIAEQTRRMRRSSTLRMRDWMNRHLLAATDLPEQERHVYLSSTIDVLELASRRAIGVSRMERCIKMLSRAERSAEEGRWAQLRLWYKSRLLWRASERLQCVHEMYEDRLETVLEMLHSPGLHDDMRKLLVTLCLRDAKEWDEDCQDLLSSGISRVRKDSYGFPVDALSVRLFVSKERLLLGGGSVLWGYGADSDADLVEAIPARVYKGLAGALFSAAGSNCSGAEPVPIIGSADQLRDGPTRAFALRQLIDSVINCTILDRAEAEPLEISTLGSLLPKPTRFRPDHGVAVPDDSSPGDADLSLPEVIESCAFDALIDRTTSASPEARGALLDLVTGWRPHAGLLYLLFYAAGTSWRASVQDLRPFHATLRLYRNGWVDEVPNLRDDIVTFFKRSNMNHLVSPEGLAWLIDSLERPLTLELCAEFEARYRHGEIATFRLMHFLQWRIIAGREVRWGANLSASAAEVVGISAAFETGTEIRQFAEQWEDCDPHASYLLADLVSLVCARPTETGSEQPQPPTWRGSTSRSRSLKIRAGQATAARRGSQSRRGESR